MAQDFGIIARAVDASGAAAEEFLFCKELLVDFEAGFEADQGIILWSHFTKSLKEKVLHREPSLKK
jgi:hypothetical protein